jgi:hypothetical protein
MRAITTTVVPEAAKLDVSGWTALEMIINESFDSRSGHVQRRIRLFLRVIEWSALLRHGRFFTSLDLERRTRHLQYLQNHSLELIRVGSWGIRTLVFMGYYGQTVVTDDIGYRPDPRGWSAPR